MLRTTVSKVMWVGRATVFLVGLAVILALVVGVASTAFGANGDAFRLGQGNVATKLTSLGGALGVNGAMLKVANKNGGTDDTALRLEVDPAEPPMSINSTTRVVGLNADQVDGQDASQFVPTGTNAFVKNNIYKRESAVVAGEDKGGGTFAIAQACDSGDVLLSGGPANVSSTSTMVESFPTPGSTNSWSARIQKNGLTDNFSVVVLCADQ